MTILAGLLAEHAAISEDRIAALRSALGRGRLDTVYEKRLPGLYLAKLDLGMLDGAGWIDEGSQGLSGVVGEPLPGSVPADRQQQLRTLHGAFRAGRFDVLERCRGTFAALHLAPERGLLHLFTDRIGVRPLYVARGDGLLLFASALGVIERSGLIDLGVDLDAVAEASVFGVPLGTRTPYREVECLRECTHLTLSLSETRPSPRVRSYFRWDRCEQQELAPCCHAGHVLERFQQAIAVRRSTGGNGDTASRMECSFLSGGLDSRAIVAELRAQGATVHGYNFSFRRMLDAVLAEQTAEALGVTLHSGRLPLCRRDFDLSAILAAHLQHRPASVWSGDGGSVLAGHVYIDEPLVGVFRSQGLEAGARAFLHARGSAGQVARRLFGRAWWPLLEDLPLNAMCAELARFDCADPARALYLFLLGNDQRRHLAGHFE
ncbi:MAG: hypothetical protein KDK91_00850, partial [Gammaproteobacteria bacterium]|nr:hypothetical protein [Gammaproteobacteria bacterium]